MPFDLHLFSPHSVGCSGSTPPEAVEEIKCGVQAQLLSHDTESLGKHPDRVTMPEQEVKVRRGWLEEEVGDKASRCL